MFLMKSPTMTFCKKALILGILFFGTPGIVDTSSWGTSYLATWKKIATLRVCSATLIFKFRFKILTFNNKVFCNHSLVAGLSSVQGSGGSFFLLTSQRKGEKSDKS